VTKKPVRLPQEEAAWEEDATWDDDINSWDAAESYSEDYADPYAATSNQRPPRRKKSEHPGKLLRVGLFVMLALIAFGAVGGIGYLAITHLPSLNNNVVDMSWMPAKVDGFAYFEPARIAATPFVQAIEKKFPQSVTRDLDGVAAVDIDSILIGFWQDEGSQSASPPSWPISSPISSWGFAGGQRSMDFLRVTKLNKDVVAPFGSEPKNGEYKGIILYSSAGKISCMPNSRTMLVGSERSVKAAIDGNGKQFNHSGFQFVSGSGNVVLAALESSTSKPLLSNTPAFSAPSFPNGSPFDASQNVGALFKQHACAGYLVINVDTRASFSGGVLCYDDAGATSLDQELATALDNGRKQLALLKSIPPLAALSGPLTTLLDSLVIAQNGTTVTVAGSLEQSLIDAIPSNLVPLSSSFGSPGR